LLKSEYSQRCADYHRTAAINDEKRPQMDVTDSIYNSNQGGELDSLERQEVTIAESMMTKSKNSAILVKSVK
jgi:hypothetical protein